MVGLEDIQVRLKCTADGCKERVPLLTNRGEVSISCGQGHIWVIEDKLLLDFLISLAQPQAIQEKANKAGFSVLLEFSELVK